MTEHLILIWIRMGSIIFISVCVIFTLFFLCEALCCWKKSNGRYCFEVEKTAGCCRKKIGGIWNLNFYGQFPTFE